jgi:hypothetical protein
VHDRASSALKALGALQYEITRGNHNKVAAGTTSQRFNERSLPGSRRAVEDNGVDRFRSGSFRSPLTDQYVRPHKPQCRCNRPGLASMEPYSCEAEVGANQRVEAGCMAQ